MKEVLVIAIESAFIVGGFLLSGYVVMTLCNFLFPGLLGLPIGQGLAVLLLLSIIVFIIKSSK